MKLSELLGLRLIDARGHVLGHVMDVRGRRPEEPGDFRAAEIVFGRRGFLERIGFGKGRANVVAWSDVEVIAPDAIRLREGVRVDEMR